MITGDARANVGFYGDVLGLRLVKKTVNFDAREAYHPRDELERSLTPVVNPRTARRAAEVTA
jgi:catechol 2,3-dioxygenase-like lactoylglutathione lyase family enzyme